MKKARALLTRSTGADGSKQKDDSRTALVAQQRELEDIKQRHEELVGKYDNLLGKFSSVQEALVRLDHSSKVEQIGLLAMAEAARDETVSGQSSSKGPYRGPGPECTICAGTNPANLRLCGSCHRYDDARHGFYCCEDSFTLDPDTAPISLAALQKRECLVCEAVATAVLDKYNPDVKEQFLILNLGPFAFQWSNGSNYMEMKGNRARSIPMEIVQPDEGPTEIRCVFYVLAGNDPLQFFDESQLAFEYGRNNSIPAEDFIGLQLVLHYADSARGLNRIRPWEAPYFHIQSLVSQLDKCELTHEGPCQGLPDGGLPEGFRLVDVRHQCVVDEHSIDRRPRYTALSYPWASQEHFPVLTKSSLLDFEHQRSLSPSNVSKTVWEAMELTYNLGERYIWIDRLCIVQDDDYLRNCQIQAMDRIYQGAIVTIIAAADPVQSPGLPGSPGNRRKNPSLHHQWRDYYYMPHLIDGNFDVVIKQSLWNTRAWTFQERFLSRRCIFITEHQVYFTCAKGVWEEEHGSHSNSYFEVPSLARLQLDDFTHADRRNIVSYCGYVEAYTSRNLTVSGDILNAFAGVAGALTSQWQTTFHFGLPERYLLPSLLWTSSEAQQPRDTPPRIPSWSWASWMGTVHYKWESRREEDRNDFGTLVRFYMPSESSDALHRLNVDEQWFGNKVKWQEGGLPGILPDLKLGVKGTVKNFAAPSTQFWRQMEQSPWTLTHEPSFDGSTLEVAALHPGALVFRTTIATLYLHCERDQDRDGWASCTIVAPDGAYGPDISLYPRIGHATPMTLQWLHDNTMTFSWASWDQYDDHRTYHECEVVVLGAGIGSSLSRDDLWGQHSMRELEGLGAQTAFSKVPYSPWTLLVMLIRRNGQTCSRVGIGIVEARYWTLCRPRWDSIVLI